MAYEGRTVRFLNGRVSTTPEEIVRTFVQYTTRVPASCALGIAARETPAYYLDEEDTESTGFVSTGVFQLSRADAARALRPLADLTSLEDSCAVLATILEGYLDTLEAAAGGIDDATFFAAGGAAYLGWAHNAGPGGVPGKFGPIDSIRAYGLDWSALKQRPDNQAPGSYMAARMIPYGDDCITGGRDWSTDLASVTPPAGAATGFKPRLGLLLLLLLLMLLYVEA